MSSGDPVWYHWAPYWYHCGLCRPELRPQYILHMDSLGGSDNEVHLLCRYTIDLSGPHSETLLLTLGLDQLNVTMPNTMASLISEHRENIYRSYFSQLTKMQVGTLKNVLKKSNV